MSTPHPRDRVVETLLAQHLSSLEPGPGSSCPDAGLMAAWAERGLDEPAHARVERHISSCSRCMALAATLAVSEPEAEATVPWWRRFDVRWLAPLGAAAAATLLWVVAPDAPEGPTGAPADTVARFEAPASVAEETARPTEPVPAAPPVTAPVAPVPPAGAVAGAESNEARARAGLDAAAVASPQQDQTAAMQQKATTRPSEAPALADTEAAQSGRLAAEETRTAAAESLERATAARAAASPAQAPQAVAAQPGAAAPPAAVAESAPAPAPPAAPGAPATLAGAARAEAASRWRVTDGRVEREAPAGNGWTTVPSDQRVTAVAGVTAQVAWVVGRAGLVMRTLDGRAWTRTAAPTTDDLAGITADDARSATVRSVAGARYRTTDGGVTWTAVP